MENFQDLTSKKHMAQIQDFWTNNAKTFGASHEASWSDKYCIELEIREILNYLKDGDSVLDVGCANAYSTIRYACEKDVTIKGIDYIDEMIKNAQKRKKEFKKSIVGKVDFQVGNILKLADSDHSYDKVIAVRVICNLFNSENQKKGLLECARVLKNGGFLLFSEPTIQGWEKLNKFRAEWQLEKIGMPDQNRYLDENFILDILQKNSMRLVKVQNFASTYFVMTRIIKPLMSYARGIENNIVDPDLEWNRLSSLLPAFGDYGIQKLFIFQKG